MLLIGILVALGQAVGGGPGPQLIARQTCQAIEVASPRVPGVPTSRVPSFAATQIIDLKISAVLRSAPPSGVLRFKVHTPGGFLYQTLAVPFVTAGQATALPDARGVEGFPRAVPVQVAQVSASDGLYRVTATLPVAGTLITTNGLYGRWTVQPWLDGASAPCGPSSPFVIAE